MQEFQTNAERMNVWDLLEACILLTGFSLWRRRSQRRLQGEFTDPDRGLSHLGTRVGDLDAVFVEAAELQE